MNRGPLMLFGDLVAKVDAFFDRVHAKHKDAMQCGKGCSDCCCDRLTITLLEAATIATAIGGMSDAEKTGLAEWASRDEHESCAALSRDGACMIYAARPLICRTHGVPIRYGRPVNEVAAKDDAVRLPVVTACFKNFDGGASLDRVPAEDVLDQTTVSATLGALDAAFADECGVPRGTRIDLAELLVKPGEFFEVD